MRLGVLQKVKLDTAICIVLHKPYTNARNSMTGASTGAQELTHVANPVTSILQDRGMQIVKST